MIRNKTTYYYECFSLGHENIGDLVFYLYFYFSKFSTINIYIYLLYHSNNDFSFTKYCVIVSNSFLIFDISKHPIIITYQRVKTKFKC